MSVVQLKCWTREQYDRMASAGIFAPDERIELLDGEIIQKAALSPRHAAGIQAARETLRAAFGAGFEVRTGLPLIVDPDSETEPDAAVVRGHWRDFLSAHPSSALLVVEISDSSLAFDRQRKGWIYATAATPEYWIVNLLDWVVEVYRDPRPDLGYGTRLVFGADQQITPLTMPSARVPVKDLLP